MTARPFLLLLFFIHPLCLSGEVEESARSATTIAHVSWCNCKCVGHGVAGDHSLFLSNESILLSHLISRNNNHYVYFGRLDRKRMSVTTRCSRTGIRMNNLFLLLCQPWTNYSQQSIIIIIIIISFDFLIVSELSCHNTVIIIITTVTTTIIPRDLAVRMRHL